MTEATDIGRERPLPPVETGLFVLDEVLKIEATEFSDVKVKLKKNFDHDLVLQKRANEIAVQLITPHGRKPTKEKVAKSLAVERGEKFETILRRIRMQW